MYKSWGWSNVRERKEEDEERGEKEWERVTGQRRPAFASFKSPFFLMYRQGQESLPGNPREAGQHSRWRWWGLDPDGVEKKRSDPQNGDALWNQSQQDLLMDWTWEMSKGESCHAHLQVSGLSTWVDGEPFP